jgi:hypothetical protein
VTSGGVGSFSFDRSEHQAGELVGYAARDPREGATEARFYRLRENANQRLHLRDGNIAVRPAVRSRALQTEQLAWPIVQQGKQQVALTECSGSPEFITATISKERRQRFSGGRPQNKVKRLVFAELEHDASLAQSGLSEGPWGWASSAGRRVTAVDVDWP